VAAAEAATGAGDDGDAAVEVDLCHERDLPGLVRNGCGSAAPYPAGTARPEPFRTGRAAPASARGHVARLADG
jgi:hypothetical protein